MKKVLFISILSFFLTFKCLSQILFAHSWYNSGESFASQFIEMADSSFYIVGVYDPTYMNPNDKEALLMHLNKYGDTLWTKRLGTTSTFRGIAPYNDTSFIVYGHLYFINTSLPAEGIARMNLDGDSIWLKRQGYPYSSFCSGQAGHIQQCSDGGYIMFNNYACDYGWLKTDSAGNEQWHDWHNMAFACWEIKPDNYGGYVSTGSNGNSVTPYEVARLDSSGAVIWHLQYGNNPLAGIDDFIARDVVQTSDSNYVVGTDGADWQFMKLDRKTGDTLWTRTYNDTVFALGYSVTCMDTASNDRIICATFRYFLYLDANGDTIWRKRNVFYNWNFASYDDVHQTLDGGFAFCGSAVLSNPFRTVIIFVKLDSLGNTVLTNIYEPETGTPLSFYPNPAQNELYISNGTFANEKQIIFTLHDLQGRVVLQEQYDKSGAVNLRRVPNGIYVAVLKGKEEEMRGKVIVQK